MKTTMRLDKDTFLTGPDGYTLRPFDRRWIEAGTEVALTRGGLDHNGGGLYRVRAPAGAEPPTFLVFLASDQVSE